MSLTNRKTIIFPPLLNGCRYVVSRPTGEKFDYLFHVYTFLSVSDMDLNLVKYHQNKVIICSLDEMYKHVGLADLPQEVKKIELNNLITRVMERKLHVVSDDQIKMVSYITSVTITDESIIIVLNYEIIEFLIWQQNYWGRNNLNKVDFGAPHFFQSVYSEVIYNQIITTSSPELKYTVEEFRILVWAHAVSYSEIHKLRQKVVKPIENDINKYTDYKIKFEFKKSGNKITHIVLKIDR